MGASPDSSQQPARKIALVDASGTASTSALVADAAEALPVYAWLAKTEEPALVEARCGEDLAGSDTVLLALELGPNAPRVDELPLNYAAAGARVYALLCADDDPEVATHTLTALAERCEERGLAWMGGLVIGDAGLLPSMARRPRMGWARRRISEALDQLLIALLAAEPAGEKYVRPSRYARLTCRLR